MEVNSRPMSPTSSYLAILALFVRDFSILQKRGPLVEPERIRRLADVVTGEAKERIRSAQLVVIASNRLLDLGKLPFNLRGYFGMLGFCI